MKKTDIAMILLVLALSGGLAFGILSFIPGIKLDSDTSVKVRTIDKYSSTIAEPDPKVFNSGAINPTVDITIGSKNNTSNNE